MSVELPELGKIPRPFFDEVIYPRLGRRDASVLTGPRHGVDVGVVTLGGAVPVRESRVA